VLDLHQHAGYSGRTDDQLVSHQTQIGVTTTVVLPGAGWMLEVLAGNEACAALGQRYDHPFIRFGNADPSAADAIATLTATLAEWAVGIGEQKFPVAVDSPEMRRVYDLARERKVPVLLHFEHEKYNLGIENLPKILDAYPEVSFIGHAQTWWANVSANPNPAEMYPHGPVTPGGLPEHLRRPLGKLRPERAHARRELHARIPRAPQHQAHLGERLQLPRRQRRGP
jgi:hypothetical protein